MVDADLKCTIRALCRVLQHLGHFDEAHCVSVAAASPSLCSSEYIRMGLERAGSVASLYGLEDVARWISQITTASRCPTAA